MRRSSTEMKIMRMVVKEYLRQAKGDYKKAYNIYIELRNKNGEEEAKKIDKLSHIKGIADFRNEAKRFVYIEEGSVEIKTDTKTLHGFAEEEENEEYKNLIFSLAMDIDFKCFDEKKYSKEFLDYIVKKIEKNNCEKANREKRLKNLKMTKSSFRELFADKLEKYFGFKFYWNGKEAKEHGLSSNGYLGVSYTDIDNRPIVLTFRKDNYLGMFSTLIHEYAHSYLHHKINLNSYEKEIEAETVAKKVFSILRLDTSKHDRYINSFKRKHRRIYGREYNLTHDRIYKIMDLVKILLDVFSSEKEIIKSLKNRVSVVKSKKIYQIICKDCGKVVATRKTLRGALNLCSGYISGCCSSKLDYRELIK